MMLFAMMMIQEAEPLWLRCTGSTTTLVASGITTTQAIDSWGNAASAVGSTLQPATVPGVVEFKMDGDEARIHLPPIFLRDRRKGDNGWFRVRKLSLTDNQISGRITLGLIDTTGFQIDRISGTMTSENGFTGECEPVVETKRRF